MVTGEGSGWHRQSRRHSEAARKSRPTHARRSETRPPIEVTLSDRQRAALKILDKMQVRVRVMELDLHGGVLEVQLFHDNIPDDIRRNIRTKVEAAVPGKVSWTLVDDAYWGDVHHDPIDRWMTTTGNGTGRF